MKVKTLQIVRKKRKCSKLIKLAVRCEKTNICHRLNSTRINCSSKNFGAPCTFVLYFRYAYILDR